MLASLEPETHFQILLFGEDTVPILPNRGEEWFSTTEQETFPPGPMHLAVQLDWFPDSDDERSRESRMEVDWVMQYPLDSGSGTERDDRDERGDR